MIDSSVLFSLELFALAVLVGVGVWRIYRTRQPTTINASAPVAHDMRRDGQRLSVPDRSPMTRAAEVTGADVL